MALSPYDQSVYDAGYKYIPQSQYLLNPFQVPAGSENEVPTGIATTYQAQNMMGGGGGGFNPYSPDMSQIRTDYRPNFDFRQSQDFEGRYGDSLTGMDRKQMDMYPDYYGINTGVPKTGIGAAFSKIADFIPYVGTFKRGAEFIGGLLKDKLPINQRALLENELRGSGVLTDDIGRIVAGPGGYNTPEGIMAGYNAAKMTDATFDKRTDRISKTLGDKYGISSQDIQGLIDGTLDDDDISAKYGITTNLTSNIRNINLAKQNFINKQRKANQIAEFQKQERAKKAQAAAMARAQNISRQEAQRQQQAIQQDYRDDRGGDAAAFEGSTSGYDEGNYCFDPNTPIQMADGSEKKIKEIQLGDQTKGGEVTGVFQFKASDEIHDYKGVTVAGSHYVKEDGRFIMVKDSPISVKIDKIPVVYSLDTTGRRIFIKDIEFADYNGDGIAKGFLANAGVDLSGFDKEVLRQVENRLI
jgi:hypothetical protein